MRDLSGLTATGFRRNGNLPTIVIFLLENCTTIEGFIYLSKYAEENILIVRNLVCSKLFSDYKIMGTFMQLKL